MFVGKTQTRTVAGYGTDFATAFGESYDAVPSGYSTFPTTSILENRAFWGPGYYHLAGRRVGVASPGKPVRLVFNFKTRQLKFDDYTANGALATNQWAHKSYFGIIKFDSELGQLCGVLGVDNKAILGEVRANVMYKITNIYQYRWVSGAANQKPTIYGSNIGASEAVAGDALGWISVPSLKAVRDAYAHPAATPETAFGALSISSRHETYTNPILDCAGDVAIPSVFVHP